LIFTIDIVLRGFSPEPAKTPSPHNPCPFLRSLAAHGVLNEQADPIDHVADVVVTLGAHADAVAKVQQTPNFVIRLIALIGNGFGPLSVSNTYREGLNIDRLRLGPLYKHGVSSRIIDEKGNIVGEELKHMETFASEKTTKDGCKELGLDIKELAKFMDDNFARAPVATRKSIYRPMMEGEWPSLLKVFGKEDANGRRYLSTSEVRTLFLQSRLPKRIIDRLEGSIAAH